MKKRGQVTLFIIVGIVMLFSIGLFIFFRSEITKPRIPVAEIELTPVESFVTACIDSLAFDAIERIGDQSGYVVIPESVRSNHNSYLQIFGFGDAIVPYWWYKGVSAIPSLDYIKNEISAYVENNLKVCLGDFGPLRKNFKIEEKGRVEAVASINENDVSVSVRYPLKVISLINESSQEVEDFNVVMPVRLKKVYELARDIIDAENADKFLERKTIDLMVLDQSIPDTDIEITCDKREWYLPQIQERLKKLIATNFQYIKIKNAEFNDQTYLESPSSTTYNDSYFGYHYVWNVSEKVYPGMHASISYLENWPLYIYARPSRNGVLRSNSQNGFDLLEGLCLHIWHFTYDVVYPVVVEIYDEEGRGHREFRFRYATDVSVQSNTPVRENFASSILEFADRTTEDEYCSSPRNEVTVYTQDVVTQEPVPNVNLTFVCGGFSCNMNKSEILGFGAAAGISKRFPYCVSGFIKGYATGYAFAQKNIQSSLKDKAYYLDLTPIKELDVEIVKFVEGKEVQLSNERAFISISRDNFEENIAYPILTDDKLTLLGKSDYAYNITIYVMGEESVIGGYQGSLTIRWDSIKDAKKIKFFVAVPDAKDDDERFKFIAKLKEHSRDVPEPRFE
ncbi:MAG TPA: hypothetical protein VJI46_05735 [Candidatus Nanoarchaeia archaeon]|nr:hypothetical protein [Candidatus Nanoarchaeia archaeon]